ncbi:MAG: hypothetical protein PHT71_08915 [Victivallaceae bacterium]|nr:hypothetical protein [Victivallaceae bacterium]
MRRNILHSGLKPWPREKGKSNHKELKEGTKDELGRWEWESNYEKHESHEKGKEKKGRVFLTTEGTETTEKSLTRRREGSIGIPACVSHKQHYLKILHFRRIMERGPKPCRMAVAFAPEFRKQQIFAFIPLSVICSEPYIFPRLFFFVYQEVITCLFNFARALCARKVDWRVTTIKPAKLLVFFGKNSNGNIQKQITLVFKKITITKTWMAPPFDRLTQIAWNGSVVSIVDRPRYNRYNLQPPL